MAKFYNNFNSYNRWPQKIAEKLAKPMTKAARTVYAEDRPKIAKLIPGSNTSDVINAYKSGDHDTLANTIAFGPLYDWFTNDEMQYGDLGSQLGSGYESLPVELRQYLNDLSESELESLYREYTDDYGAWEEFLGKDDKFRGDDLLNDLRQLQDAARELNALGDVPIYQDYLDTARLEADKLYSGMYSDLDALEAQRTQQYQDEIAGIKNDYGALRSSLLSQNYTQNAQLLDGMQSNMDRARRNAIEAGATAGVRIAENINALLSTQNKQAATSMDTANQLAQMMVNQRNAEASANRSYSDYMAQSTGNRHSLQREQDSYAGGLADRNFTAAKDSYDAKKAAIDNKYSLDNMMYDRVNKVKTYYSQGGN